MTSPTNDTAVSRSALTIDEVVERVTALPHLPDTLMRLVSVVSDPRSSLSQIVETIRYDQVITAEVLRLCNSAYFGLARTVESLDDAVRLLGTLKIMQLVMAAHSRALLSRAQEGYGLPAGALWSHSVAVALGGQLLARQMKLQQVGLLFTAGLLHDVGKVVLNEYVARDYAEIARRVQEDHITFCEAEAQVLGFTHPEVGSRLADTWSLPDTIARCIRYHHEPKECPIDDPLVHAIHLSDSVCLMMGVGGGDDGLAYRCDPDIMTRYKIGPEDLDLLGADLITELHTVQALFSS